MSLSALIGAIRRLNRWIARLLGVALLAMGALILIEIALRRTVGSALGGSDEIAGYVMAAIAAWGFAYALGERAHVRIDLLHRRLPPSLGSWLDVIALALTAMVAALVSFYGWRVLATTLDRGSRANTPLETPLWIPQAIWVGGWLWFTAAATILLIAALAAALRGRWGEVGALAGTGEAVGGDER